MFFNQAFGGGGAGGSPSASAFTSPGMNPQMLAQLMAMGGGATPGAMAPQMPATPANATGNNATPGAFPTPPQVPPSNLLQALQGLGNNPQLMQKILAMLSGGGNAGAAGALPGAPNNWVGMPTIPGGGATMGGGLGGMNV